MTTALNTLGALLIAAILCMPAGLHEWLASLPSHQSEHAAARQAEAAQRQEQRTTAAALAMCRAATGSWETVAIQQADGAWRCATHRGHFLTPTPGARP